MKKTLAVLALACLSLLATPLLAGDGEKTHGLMTVDSAWMKAMLANDPVACAAVYADDAVLVLPGSGAIKGRKAIEEAYTGWLKTMKVTDVKVLESHYVSGGDTSSGWGAWSVTTVPRAGGDPVTETGRWTAVAVKKDGKWLYAADHASSDPVAK